MCWVKSAVAASHGRSDSLRRFQIYQLFHLTHTHTKTWRIVHNYKVSTNVLGILYYISHSAEFDGQHIYIIVVGLEKKKVKRLFTQEWFMTDIQIKTCGQVSRSVWWTSFYRLKFSISPTTLLYSRQKKSSTKKVQLVTDESVFTKPYIIYSC